MKPIVFDRLAEAELRDAVEYYERSRAGLGCGFREAVEDLLDRIRQFPQAYPLGVDQKTRKARLFRFPFSVFYVERDDDIWVAAVAHHKRRPGYWSARRPPP